MLSGSIVGIIDEEFMMEERYYNRTEVCEILGITNFTITNWYRWQNTLIKNGEIDKQYLPAPIRQKNVKGQPLFWTDCCLAH